MKQIPIKDFDEEINLIIIRKPKHTLTIGPIFQSLKKLEILRIIESNVPAVGMHSFWGVPSLRILGMYTGRKSFFSVKFKLKNNEKFIKVLNNLLYLLILPSSL